MDTIKNTLQPFLKVKIDSVGDFDYGLKEVFEKRPAFVFFQDQIAGVTGESVVRHIQMLLGPDAPSFIIMHNGNPKAKSIKGLYDYLIDLSQDNTKVVADIQSTLKILLGPRWQKFYVPPKKIKSEDMAALIVPAEHHAVANHQVDDFISDLGDVTDSSDNKSPLPGVPGPESSMEEPVLVAPSTHDQLEKIFAEETSKLLSDSGIGKVSVTPKTVLSSSNSAPAEISQQIPAAVAHKGAAVPEESLSAQDTSPEKKSSPNAPISADMSEKSPSPLISPADFKIERERIALEVASEESLRAFEANYLSKAAARKRYQSIAVVLVLSLMVVGGLFVVKQKPHLLQSVVKETATAIVPVPATHPVKPVPALQKSVSTTQMPESAALPSFIPRAGYDRTFPTQKPGWERYVGTDSEFRVFRSDGKLKALQVLATEDHVISESRLKTILNELAGTGDYQITSLEQKNGFQVSRATVNRKADLLIYRKKSAVRAFVISLD